MLSDLGVPKIKSVTVSTFSPSICHLFTLAPWCEDLTHWKKPWFWERLKAGGEGDDRGWDGWMASPTQWTWVRASSGSWWWTGKPGILQSMGSQEVGHDWATDLNWTDVNRTYPYPVLPAQYSPKFPSPPALLSQQLRQHPRSQSCASSLVCTPKSMLLFHSVLLTLSFLGEALTTDV